MQLPFVAQYFPTSHIEGDLRPILLPGYWDQSRQLLKAEGSKNDSSAIVKKFAALEKAGHITYVREKDAVRSADVVTRLLKWGDDITAAGARPSFQLNRYGTVPTCIPTCRPSAPHLVPPHICDVHGSAQHGCVARHGIELRLERCMTY